MSPFQRAVWIIALFMFISGCAGYRRASLPGPQPNNEIGEPMALVEAGSEVRLALTTGEVISGKVLQASGEYLVLEIPNNSGLNEVQIPNNQISSLEVRKKSRIKPLLLVGAAVVVVVVVVFVAATKEKAIEVVFQDPE